MLPPLPSGISENGPIKTQMHKLIPTKFQTVMKCKLSFVMYDTFSSGDTVSNKLCDVHLALVFVPYPR